MSDLPPLSPASSTILNWTREAIDTLKAQDILELDVRSLTTLTDTMVICSGTSNRHVQSIAQAIMDEAKSNDHPFHIEGLENGEWVLVDLFDVVVHVMLPETREYYKLEQLWSS